MQSGRPSINWRWKAHWQNQCGKHFRVVQQHTILDEGQLSGINMDTTRMVTECFGCGAVVRCAAHLTGSLDDWQRVRSALGVFRSGSIRVTA